MPVWKNYVCYQEYISILPYSLKFLRVKIFEGFLSGLENFILENFGPSQAPLENLAKPRKFYHENFFLKEKSLNLENFNPRIFRLYGMYS